MALYITQKTLIGMKNKLKVKIGDLLLKSPLLTASGTSGSSSELDLHEKYESIINVLGGFITKGVTINKREGNKPPRIVETSYGIINSIGLQNYGVDYFCLKELPHLQTYKLPIIINISASTVEGFGELTARLMEKDVNDIISGIEINVSCPNIKEGGVAFGVNPILVEKIVMAVKKNIKPNITMITKLSPNVTDITIPAQAAINGGTNALSLINTLRGMSINVETRMPHLGSITGGLSGPAIKPIGVFMVYECYRMIKEIRKNDIPIIGVGGISNYKDALEYIMAGASAISIGTAWFVNNNVFNEIHKGLILHLNKKNISTITELIGISHRL